MYGMSLIRVNFLVIAITLSIFGVLLAGTSANAAPPDDDCASSTITCASQPGNPATSSDMCAFCSDEDVLVDPVFERDDPRYSLKLTPSAEILYPNDGDTFYVNEILGYAEIPLRGRANDESRMLTGREIAWVISDGIRNAYAYAQNESTLGRVYHRGDGCIDLLVIMDAIVLHYIVAYDTVNITVCRGYSQS